MDSLPKNCYWKLGERDNKEHTVITLMTLRKFRLPPKTEKLSHPSDCNIVGEAKLPLSLIFLLIVDRIQVKICVMFQYSTKRKKCQIFSIWHFHIFSYNKIEKNPKFDINFQFLILNKNWMDEWHTELVTLKFVNTVIARWINQLRPLVR